MTVNAYMAGLKVHGLDDLENTDHKAHCSGYSYISSSSQVKLGDFDSAETVPGLGITEPTDQVIKFASILPLGTPGYIGLSIGHLRYSDLPSVHSALKHKNILPLYWLC